MNKIVEFRRKQTHINKRNSVSKIKKKYIKALMHIAWPANIKVPANKIKMIIAYIACINLKFLGSDAALIFKALRYSFSSFYSIVSISLFKVRSLRNKKKIKEY
jgi:hypothetical protein